MLQREVGAEGDGVAWRLLVIALAPVRCSRVTARRVSGVSFVWRVLFLLKRRSQLSLRSSSIDGHVYRWQPESMLQYPSVYMTGVSVAHDPVFSTEGAVFGIAALPTTTTMLCATGDSNDDELGWSTAHRSNWRSSVRHVHSFRDGAVIVRV